MDILRTPAERFESLPGYDFSPNYQSVGQGQTLRMHYVDEGPRDAPVVLMLHGEPTWSFLYRKMIGPVVAAGWRAVAPDMIGFGKSDKPSQRDDYSYDRFVDWMRDFLLARDLDRIVLVCQDWGGPIGLRLLSEFPERFDGVLATNTLLPNCESPPRGVAHWPGEFIAAWKQLCADTTDLPIGQTMQATFVTPVSELVVAAYEAPFPDPAYKAGPHQITLGIPFDEDAEGLDANRQAWEVLDSFEKPFLTAFSDSDPTTAAWADVFQARIPGAKGLPHTVIPQAGHFVQEEQGEALARVLVDLLGLVETR